MSDDEQHDFTTGDAGASTTYPQQAGTIRKGGYVVLKGRPCKVVETSTSKTGKHGHAKVHFVGIDIFTNKKYEDLCPSSHNMDVPNVGRTDYNLLDIDGDNFCTLMDSKGETKSDLRVPEGELGDLLKKQFEDGKELVVTVVGAMNEEQISAIKEAPK
eukprot:EC121828.1.p1 GENE.EC121828.1~~EC121828.1.p1  ORF type:complete len:158 (+),score=32.63 EC121828.1:83-556(+)